MWSIDVDSASTAQRRLHSIATPKLTSVSHAHKIPLVVYDPISKLLAIQTSDRSIELARIRDADEVKRKTARKRRRETAKGKDVEMQQEDEPSTDWSTRIASYTVLRSLVKIQSFAFASPGSAREARGKLKTARDSKDVHLLLSLVNNSLQSYSVPLASTSKATPEAVTQFTVALAGHRTDARALAISSDDALIASASNGELKIWNRRSLKCLRTITDSGYAMTAAWLPGDRHVRSSASACPS